MRTHHVILVAALLCTVPLAGVAATTDDVVRVCPADHPETCDEETIQDGVDAAEEGDTVEVLAGTYVESVEITTASITLEGVGPEETIVEGDDSPENGINVYADDVTVRDLRVQNFRGDGVYFDGVIGFYVENVEAVDNGAYGIYAIRSEVGWFKDSYAAGHSDSGVYIGETLSCECVIENVLAEDNLIGYSGTSASHITIRDSTFRHNAAGVVPNVLPQERFPQTNLVVIDNEIVDNNREDLSKAHHFSGGVHVPHGLGVVLAGGIDNLVTDNTITGHERGGVVLAFLFAEPSNNRVVGNELANGPPEANDLMTPIPDRGVDILWDGGGVNNCFEANERVDSGDTVTFEAGPVWNAAGTLPDCSTPNAGAPSPLTLAYEVSLLVTGCEPGDHADPATSLLTEEGCHEHVSQSL